MSEAAEAIIRRTDRLFSSIHFTNNSSISQDVASLFIPRRAEIQHQNIGKGDVAGWYDHLYDSSGTEAVKILAQGAYDLLYSGDWFETHPPHGDTSFDRKEAYDIVGQRMREAMAGSNFILEIQEQLLDWASVHTSAVLIEEDEEELFFLTSLPPGSYAIMEDHKKRVDLLCRKFKLTARQAKQKYNKETDKLGQKVNEAFNSTDKQEDLFEFRQIIEPRLTGVVEGSQDPRKMPWASITVCYDDKIIVRDSGYEERPFICARFERWGDSPWGTGPCHLQMPTCRGLQHMKRTRLALGDRITSPGTFVGPDQEVSVDPFGETEVSWESAAHGLPREYVYHGNFEVSEQSIKEERLEMEESFFVPLFKLLTSPANQEREKTAYEVAKMLEELVGRTSPVFVRNDRESTIPIINRVFGIMLRAGEFDDILDRLVGIDQNGNGIDVELPEIIFTSKLAKAIKVVKSNAYIQFTNTLGFIIEQRPQILDNTDWDKVWRNLWKDTGLPIQELFSEREVAATREQQAQTQRMQEDLVAAEMASNVMKNAGGR